MTGRRDRKKRRTRADLVRAAVSLVEERGFDRVTVEDISAAAGVSARTFFNYFTGKEEAVVGPDPEAGPRIRAHVLAQPDDVPTLQAVRSALLAEIADEGADERALLSVRMRIVQADPGLLARVFAGGRRTEEHLVTAIAERTGLAAGDAYPLLLAAAASAALRCAMTRWATTDRSLPDLLGEAVDLLAVGLTDPPGAHRRGTGGS
ncbi:acyl-CoA-like ligand-binding transcription factor [Saccharothrix violaceirubra]|uniref:AcrR family transcriptional regulator n=1 Tax=Saccharothrix violaceirubra TaxID=413306 RepID=A0A7W7T3A9_9PSEU|nr:TetR family transcriptional regulator [Saccharothrix violaceirubra]MBB4965803.1 AcrR family transcriptional regulator [Saccharothrix violaceirubra]